MSRPNLTKLISALSTAVKYKLSGRFKPSTSTFRKYKPSEMRARTSAVSSRRSNGQRPRIKHDKNQEVLTYNHGKSVSVSNNFKAKVKEAASNTNSMILKGSDVSTTSYNECSYWGSAVIFNVNDVLQIRSTLLTTAQQKNTVKFMIDYAETTTQITNQTNVEAKLQIYECVARHDIPYSAPYSSYWGRLADGFADASATGGSTYSPLMTDISATPFQSTHFCECFKILSVKEDNLLPGQCKKYTIIDKSPLHINTARWETYNTAGSADAVQISMIANRSKFLLIKQYGQVLNDNTTATNVGTSYIKLDYVYTTKYNYRWTNDITSTAHIGGSIINPTGSAVTLGAVTTGTTMSQGTDVPITVTTI